MLREPQKGHPITADWGREVVKAVRGNVVIGGQGIRVTAGPNGVIISAVPGGTRATRAAGTAYPRPFDIRVEGALVKLSDAYIQIGDELVGGGSELQAALPGTTSVLHLMIKRVPGFTELSLAYSAPSGRPDTMDGLMFPVALYLLESTGKVLCDLRGSNAVMYK